MLCFRRMNSLVNNLKPLLLKEGIEFQEDEKSIFIKLPNNYGELQVSDLENNDDIIGLVGSDWHTHSECLGDPEISAELKVLEMVKNIFTGKLLLIEEKEEGKEVRKTIEENLEHYLKWLPPGAEYKIYNET
jgi:hypothetical protein